MSLNSIELWQSAPEHAFEAWRRSGITRYQWAYSERSIRQHCSMFKQYLNFLAPRNVHCLAADSDHLDMFLQNLTDQPGPRAVLNRPARLPSPASAITERRYVQLLAETYDHLAQISLVPMNPMLALMDQYATLEADSAITYLTIEQEAKLLKHLDSLPMGNWKAHRNGAMLLLLLSSGVTLAELIALRTVDLKLNDFTPLLNIEANSPIIEHSAPVSGFAVQPLGLWLARRLTLGVPGTLLFPAADGEQVDSSSVYRLVRKSLAAIDFPPKHSGPATLRNTFARRQLAQGIPPGRVQAWMGLSTDRTITKIKKTLITPGRAGLFE